MTKRYEVWRRGQNGLTLIELMIGMTLGLVVLGAVLYVFAGNRASYRHQESLSMVQETGRFALEMLGRDIRTAGYAGCGNTAFLEFLSGAAAHANAIVGTVGADAVTPDSVTVWHGIGDVARVVTNAVPTQIVADNAALLGTGPGGQILVTDCVYAEVVNLTAVAGNTLTVDPLVRTYGPGSQIVAFETVPYDVVGGALRRATQGISEGVINMKVLYGVDTSTPRNRSADTYVANPSAAQAPNIVSARITLTVEDGDVTLPFTTTVTLRNRAP